MTTQFKAKGYERYRNSEKKIFTHATIYLNQGMSDFPQGHIVAGFHTSLEAAEKDVKVNSKRTHMKFIEIVQVEKVSA